MCGSDYSFHQGQPVPLNSFEIFRASIKPGLGVFTIEANTLSPCIRSSMYSLVTVIIIAPPFLLYTTKSLFLLQSFFCHTCVQYFLHFVLTLSFLQNFSKIISHTA